MFNKRTITFQSSTYSLGRGTCRFHIPMITGEELWFETVLHLDLRNCRFIPVIACHNKILYLSTRPSSGRAFSSSPTGPFTESFFSIKPHGVMYSPRRAYKPGKLWLQYQRHIFYTGRTRIRVSCMNYSPVHRAHAEITRRASLLTVADELHVVCSIFSSLYVSLSEIFIFRKCNVDNPVIEYYSSSDIVPEVSSA